MQVVQWQLVGPHSGSSGLNPGPAAAACIPQPGLGCSHYSKSCRAPTIDRCCWSYSPLSTKRQQLRMTSRVGVQGKWRNAGWRRSQAIPHGVSTQRSRLVAGHQAEPFPEWTVRPWKRVGVVGDPLQGHICLKVSLFLRFPRCTPEEGGKCFLHE